MNTLKNLSILSKSLISLIPVFILLFVILGSVTVSELSSISQDIYQAEKTQLKEDINRALKVKTESIKNIVIAVSHNSNVINKMYDEDRESIFNEISSLYIALEESKSFHKPLIQVVDSMGTSYVKSWDKSAYGAIVTDRESVVYVQEKHKIYVGNEVTRGGLMIVATGPLILLAEDEDEEDEFLGGIDFILRFNELVFKKKNPQDHRDMLVLVDQKHLEKAVYIKDPNLVENYYVDLNKNTINTSFLQAAQNIDMQQLLSQGYLIDEDYFYTYENIRTNEGKELGIFLLGKPIADVEKTINTTSKAFMTLISIVLFAMLVILAILVIVLKKVVSRPIQDLAEVAKELSSGDGDLTKRLEEKSQDEIGKTAHFVNKFIQKVQGVVSDVIISGHNTADEIAHISRDIDQMDSRMKEERSLVDKTTTLTSKIQDLLVQSVDDSMQTVEKVGQAVSNLNDANKTMSVLVEDVTDMSVKEHEMSDSLSQLSDDANEVKSVLTVISDIADQTNLLALNAAIEAARAGEHGRGFAVVADEVRKLAERTQKTLSEIQATINVIVQSIIDTSSQMDVNAKAINRLVESTNSVEHKIQETVEHIQVASDIARNSEQESKKLADTTQGIITNIHDINEISIQNSEALEGVQNKAKNLATGAETLNKQLGKFKV
ncbi:methyl-accepting chemotaxis protein [Sulfurimonas sp. MAG313]|nr:methyl-accepting chemotaxis protein [Sulfurimonas sp. MAG313]MDF1881559.1 methyl-accepting chemotaxis protein [Sulfurimonas sp. MAG313]